MRDDYLRDLHLANIARHAKESWQASAWLLERKFPSLFALHFKDRATESAEQPQYEKLTREELLASIARAKALEAEAPVGWQPALPDTERSSDV